MVKHESVNINLQMIISLLPIVGLFAYYRVQKLWKFIAISILVNIGVSIIILLVSVVMVTFGDSSTSDMVSNMANIIQIFQDPAVNVILIVGGIAMEIYLIRRWSKKWNEQFLQNKDNGEIK